MQPTNPPDTVHPLPEPQTLWTHISADSIPQLPGQKVWLSSRDLSLKIPELALWFDRAFPVSKVINTVAVRLCLPRPLLVQAREDQARPRQSARVTDFSTFLFFSFVTLPQFLSATCRTPKLECLGSSYTVTCFSLTTFGLLY